MPYIILQIIAAILLLPMTAFADRPLPDIPLGVREPDGKAVLTASCRRTTDRDVIRCTFVQSIVWDTCTVTHAGTWTSDYHWDPTAHLWRFAAAQITNGCERTDHIELRQDRGSWIFDQYNERSRPDGTCRTERTTYRAQEGWKLPCVR